MVMGNNQVIHIQCGIVFGFKCTKLVTFCRAIIVILSNSVDQGPWMIQYVKGGGMYIPASINCTLDF